MRAYPEAIGIVTGATASTLCAIKRNNISFIGNLFFMIASAMVTTALFSYALGMGASSVSLLLKNVFQKETWVVFFSDTMQVFRTELQAFRLSKWICNGISFIERLLNYDNKNANENTVENTKANVAENDEASVVENTKANVAENNDEVDSI